LFRRDLYYRLSPVTLSLPPLRERREDIPQLIDLFLDKFNAENERNLRRMSRDVLNLLMRYPWPGNVRELENTIERAVVLAESEDFTADLLPTAIRVFAEQERPAMKADSPDELVKQLVDWGIQEAEAGQEGSVWSCMTQVMERALIEEALKRSDGTKIKAADFLGINRNTLNKKYRELGLDHAGAEVPAG